MKTSMLIGLLLAGLAFTAQAKQPWEEYGERIKAQESIGILGDDLFGDIVNYQDGTLTFSATDISLPGNSGLPVALKRTFSASGRTDAPSYGGYDKAFADWELDLRPYGPPRCALRNIVKDAYWEPFFWATCNLKPS